MATNLEDLVAAEFAVSGPDPHQVAARLVVQIPARQLRPLLADLLAGVVREYIRANRARSDGGAMPTSRAWGTVAEISHGRLPYYVAGRWVEYGDLTAEDCRQIAADYFDRASKNEQLGKEWLERADQMERLGLERLRDLVEAA